MKRGIFTMACVLAFSAAPFRASGAIAQDTPLPRVDAAAGDTLTLSLAEAQRLVLTQNPAFLAELQETEIARGELRQARVYNFNPELEFNAPGAATAGSAGEYEAALTQEIEWAGQQGLRIRAARIGLARAGYVVHDAARQSLAAASGAFYTALAAERRLALAREILALNQRLLSATRTQLREGEISVLEANLAEIEFGRARARVLAAQRETTSARLELTRLAGLAPEQPLRLADEIPAAPDAAALDLDSMIALALERRPDLAAQATTVDQFQALRTLARREAIPKLRVGVLAERSMADNEPRIGLGVSLGLPVWDRNQGLRAQRAAQAKQAALNRSAVELRIRTQVTDSYRAYVAAVEEARVFASDVLRPARENQALLDTAFRAGKFDLPTLLLLRNQLLDAELGYWDAWLAERRALVNLEAATAALSPATEELNVNNLEDR